MGEATQSWFKGVVESVGNFLKNDTQDTLAAAWHATDKHLEPRRGEAFAEMLKGTVGDAEANYNKVINKGSGRLWNTAQKVIETKGFEKAVDAARYMGGNGDWKKALMRNGVAAAGTTAVGAGYRYASGGTFTKNADGESDIVGLPI